MVFLFAYMPVHLPRAFCSTICLLLLCHSFVFFVFLFIPLLYFVHHLPLRSFYFSLSFLALFYLCFLLRAIFFYDLVHTIRQPLPLPPSSFPPPTPCLPLPSACVTFLRAPLSGALMTCTLVVTPSPPHY